MVSRLVIGSVVLVAVGLVLVVVGNPSLRFVAGVSAPSATGTFTRTSTGAFNFTGGTFPGNFTRTALGSTARGRLNTESVESLAGVALVAAGLLLEVFSIFVRPRPAIAARSEP